LKTGIYGGTFNPIHRGHIHLLEEFTRRLELDRVLLIPTRVPPHKLAPELASGEDRMAMCRLAVGDLPHLQISDIEMRREGKSYTAETLEELSRQYPEDQFYLLMGEDMFLTVERWYRPETIFFLATVCATPRSAHGMGKLLMKKEEYASRYGARCMVEDIPYLPISSTQVRDWVREGRDITPLVPEAVAGYIKEQGIYRKGWDPMEYSEYEREVKNHLTDQRFYHSQCVAEEAVRLARRYGADEEKARLAGILHDIMKDTPPEEQLKILTDSGIILTNTQQRNRKLWHALCGAAYIRQRLGVTDPEIVDAVACHTSGKGNMTLLDKVLFIADYISADRTYPGVEDMRQAADRSLEEAMVEGIRYTVDELMGQKLPVAAESIEAYNDAIVTLEKKEQQA
jgi:nicotinate-nucleotide adenylyltransferase